MSGVALLGIAHGVDERELGYEILGENRICGKVDDQASWRREESVQKDGVSGDHADGRQMHDFIHTAHVSSSPS